MKGVVIDGIERYQGAVVSVVFRDWPGDFWRYIPEVIVWDAEAERERQLPLNESANPHLREGSSILSDETKAHMARVKRARNRKAIFESDFRSACTVAKGDTVRVIKGRKVALGTEARVFWVGNSGYGESAGLLLANGSKVFVAIGNVARLPQDVIDEMPAFPGSLADEMRYRPADRLLAV